MLTEGGVGGRCCQFQRKQKACGLLYLSLLHGFIPPPCCFSCSGVTRTATRWRRPTWSTRRAHASCACTWRPGTPTPHSGWRSSAARHALSQSQCRKGIYGSPYSKKRLTNCLFTVPVVLFKLHCKQDPIYVFPDMKLRGFVPSFHIHVSVSDLFIPTDLVHLFCCKIGRPILGLYKSLTDTWM